MNLLGRLIQFFLLSTLIWNTPVCRGQYYTTGSDPASLRWSQIKISEFRLIFPASDSLRALRTAAFFNSAIPHIGSSLDHIPRKFPVLMHSESVISNGMTILSPRRIELFPRSPVRNQSELFLYHLLIHEGRHMVQMDKLNQGITRLLYPLLGDHAIAAVFGLHIPSWMAEGDAVWTETLLSHSGRGRSPSFIRPFRTMVMEHAPRSWDQMLFGSYKYFIPNAYVFGYYMVGMSRLLGGSGFWPGALDDVARRPYRIANLSRYSLKHTGLDRQQLFTKIIQWNRQYWNSENPPPDFKFRVLSENRNDYINYLRPFQLGDNQWVVLKESLGELPAFIRLDQNRREHLIVRPGLLEEASFSVSRNWLVWAELRGSLRWSHLSYSELVVYDIRTGDSRRITHQTRYFQPALSPSAGRIAVVEESVTGRSSLLIISRLSGKIMSKVDAPPFEHFTGPVWDLNGSGVYAFLTGVNGRKLIRWVTGQDRIAVIRDFTYKEVNHLAVADNRLIFTAPAGSTEGLYQLNFDGSGLSLIGGHSQGVSYPVISGNQLFCSVYSVNGFRPAATELKNLKPEKIRQIPDLDEPMNALVQRTPGEVPVDKILSDTTFQIQPYPRWRRLLHFHSWAPVYIDPVGYQVNPGVVLMSQNELNTLSVWGGYQYLFSRSMHQMVANIHYTGMFPEITMSFAGGPVFDSLAGEGTLGHYNSWSQWMHATVTIPLNFSSGIWYRNLSLSVALVAHQNRVLQSGLLLKEDYLAGAIVSGYILRRQSHRDLYPKWGVRANMTTHYNPSGHQASLMMWSKFYLPGLLPQHSIRMYASGYFNLSPSQFPAQSWDLPRGVSGPDLFYPYNVRMDYGFPFLYPDWNVGSLLYLKRLKANLFTDLAFTKSLALASLSSGLDLTADFFLLRIGAAINGGCRIIYLPLENRWKVWPLVGFSIN